MSSETNRWCSPSRDREIALDDDIVPINDYLNGPDWWYDGLQEIQNFFPDPISSQHVDDLNDIAESAPTRIVGETVDSLEPSDLHNASAAPGLEVPCTIVPQPRQIEERTREVQFQLPRDPQHVYLNESMVSSPPPYQGVDRLANEEVAHDFSHESNPLPGTTSSQSIDENSQSFSPSDNAMPIDSGNSARISTPLINYGEVQEVGEQSDHHQPSLQGLSSATFTGEDHNGLALEQSTSSQTSFTVQQTSPEHGQAESHSLPARSRVDFKYDNGFPPFPYTENAPAFDYEDDDNQDQFIYKQSPAELYPQQGVAEQIAPPVISSNVDTGAPSPNPITKDDVADTHVPDGNDGETSLDVSSTVPDSSFNSFGTAPDDRHVVGTGLDVDLAKNGETPHTSRPAIFKPYLKVSLGNDLSASTPDEGEKTLPAGSTLSLGNKRVGAAIANREQSPMKKPRLDEESKLTQALIDGEMPISSLPEMQQEQGDAVEGKMDIDDPTESSMSTAHDLKPERIEDLDTIQAPDLALKKVASIPIPIRPQVEVRIEPSKDSIPPRSSTAPTIQDKTLRVPSGSSITEKPIPLAAKPKSIHTEDAEIMPPPASTTSKTTQQPEAETTQSKTWRAFSGMAMPNLASIEAPAFSPLTPVFPPGSLSIAPVQNDFASDSSTAEQSPQSAAVLSQDTANLGSAIATPIAKPKRRQMSLRELTSLAPDGGYVQSDTPARRSATTATGVSAITSTRRSMTPMTAAGSQRSVTSSTAVPIVAAPVASSRSSSSSSLSTIPTPVLESAQLPDKGKARAGPPQSPEKGHSRAKQTEAEDGADEQDQLSPQQKGALTKKRNAEAKAAAAVEGEGLSAQQKGALTKKRNAAAAAAVEEKLSAQQKGALTRKRNALAAASETGTPVPVTPTKSKSKSKAKSRSAASKANLDSSTDSPPSMTTNSRPRSTTSGTNSTYSAPEEADEDSEDESQSSVKRPVRRRGAPRNMLKELGISPSKVSDSPVQTRRSSAATFESGGDWASGLRRNLARRNANERASNQDDEVDDSASEDTAMTTAGNVGSGKDKEKKRDTRRGAA
ncbi:hypothetical protein BDV97DRAFT_408843 [Delphinella strobiligena]|nr:hypothetical protein BDV97DRAFT_408843 [Delphinella strobiligena]